METISRAEAKRIGLIYYFTGEPCAFGHVVDRYVRNYTCVKCEYARKRGESLQPQAPLPACRICNAQVRTPGHATCSTECKQHWDEAKRRAKYELTHRKLCHGCGAPHDRFHKWFCSAECYARHRAARHEAFVQRECLDCQTLFYARRGAKLCSSECRRKRVGRQQRAQHQRQVESGYIAAYNRKLRAKVAAAVAVARELDIVPKWETGVLAKRREARTLTAAQYDAIGERWLFDYMQMCKRPTHSDKCIVCEVQFPSRRGSGPRRTKFCSYRCRVTFTVLKERFNAGPKRCPRCEELFWPTKAYTHYCSGACSDAAATERQSEYAKVQAQRPEVKQRKRRREREQYAVMLAFKQMGLLQQDNQT